ncbi:MAG: hypothetical protein WBW84_07925, partial [Acidobacteriaceae bacterium]
TGSTDAIGITSPCALGGTTSEIAVAGVATYTTVSINVTGSCVLTATDTSRALTTAASTVAVGSPQAALTVTSLKGFIGKALNLTTSGGSGTGAVTFTVTNGTAKGCAIVGTTLKATGAGTCLVTATKAATTTYTSISSAATAVSMVLPFKAARVAGAVTIGHTETVTIIGSGFYGKPRVISNVAGLTARVTRDTGKALTIVVTVRAGGKAGTHVFTIILPNGKRTSVKFALRA